MAFTLLRSTPTKYVESWTIRPGPAVVARMPFIPCIVVGLSEMWIPCCNAMPTAAWRPMLDVRPVCSRAVAGGRPIEVPMPPRVPGTPPYEVPPLLPVIGRDMERTLYSLISAAVFFEFFLRYRPFRPITLNFEQTLRWCSVTRHAQCFNPWAWRMP